MALVGKINIARKQIDPSPLDLLALLGVLLDLLRLGVGRDRSRVTAHAQLNPRQTGGWHLLVILMAEVTGQALAYVLAMVVLDRLTYLVTALNDKNDNQG